MRKLSLLFIVICLTAAMAVAQTQPPQSQQMSTNNIAQLFFNRVKPGMTPQYEQGRKQHMAWHKSQNDPWTWYTWEVLTGEGAGSYVVGTFDHAWKDFDGREKFEAADTANAQQTVVPYQTGSQMRFVARRLDLARDTSMAGPPAKFISVLHFMVKPEGLNDFVAAVKQINQGIAKTDYPAKRSQWYMIVSGGQGPELVLVQDRNSMADMQGPDKTLDQMMQEAFGDQGTATLKSLRSTYTSTYSELLQYRPDLSYVPAGSK